MQVDRALVHGRERALLLEHPEQRTARVLDDRDGIGRARAQRDLAGRRARAAPRQPAGRAHQLAGRDELLGGVEGARAEHRIVPGHERQLVGGGAQVADADLGVRRIQDRRLVGAPQEGVGVVDEVAIERVGARHEQREALAAAPGAAPLLAQARDRAGEADRERAVEQADVDAELERLGRDHAE